MKLSLLELLYQALRETHGLRVQTPDLTRLRQKLYTIQKENPETAGLSFVQSPFSADELWIVKREQESSNAEADQ